MISLWLCPHSSTRWTSRLSRVNGAYQYLRIQVQTINSYPPLYGNGASLAYYHLWTNPGPRASSLWISVLFRLFLLLASSPEIAERAWGSPRRLWHPAHPQADYRRHALDRLCRGIGVFRKEIYCGQTSLLEKSRHFAIPPLVSPSKVGCFLRLQTDLKQKRNLTSSYN